MNDRLPYEEQLSEQLNDLPLPDENMAWEDMKRRLEEDDDIGIIPFWLRGCGIWGLLLLVLVGIGWWLISPVKPGNKKQETGYVKNIPQKGDTTVIKKNKIDVDSSGKESNSNKNANDTIRNIYKNSITDNPLNASDSSSPANSSKKISKRSPVTGYDSPHKNRHKNKTTTTGQKTADKLVEKNKQIKFAENKDLLEKHNNAISLPIKIATTNAGNNPVLKSNANNSVIEPPTDIAGKISKADSSNKVAADSMNKIMLEQPVTRQQKKDSSKSKRISFGAGLSMQQQIPINGQKLTPYNSLGRKGSLADYIPSIFFRMYKNDKWFIQSEFRYGAPQNTKEIIYQQTIIPDSSQYTTTLSSRLKKTFYHQLPLTFNYYIQSNWSLGAGIVWNKFGSAVYEQELVRRNNVTAQDSIVSKSIQRERANFDSASAFSKNYLQAVIETQYQWKRFSLGARYSFGLQPYLKFTLPGGTQQKESNRSLQVFLRYQLWKSKAKSSKEKRR